MSHCPGLTTTASLTHSLPPIIQRQCPVSHLPSQAASDSVACAAAVPSPHAMGQQLATRSPSWSRERRQSSGTSSQAGQCISTNQMQSPNSSAAYTHTTVERSRWQSYEESVSVSAINHAHALPACALSSPRQVSPMAAAPSAVLHVPLLVSLLSSTATSTPLPSLSASRRCQLGRCMGRWARSGASVDCAAIEAGKRLW